MPRLPQCYSLLAIWPLLLLSGLHGMSSETCVKCHPTQVISYAKTGMANSLGRPVRQSGGAFQHALSGSRIEITSDPAGMKHRLKQNGLDAVYRISYFVGSGNHGRSYLIELEGRLFQSPASWYTARRKWDLSPGFDIQRELDFDRPITAECLFCHSGAPRPVAFTLNSYEQPAFASEAITCERCHGPSDRHVVQPSVRNIVNPAKLPPRLRDAVCEQCHLGGEARILNPGRQPGDFRPGQSLEDTLAVYIFDRPSDSRGEAMKVVSHSEQLAASKCAQQSAGRMWCGTCHDPHDRPSQPVVPYKQRCQQCHPPTSLVKHPERTEDCVGCHMPRRRAYDGGHTAFTDHQILATPGELDSRRNDTVKLRPWREPPAELAARNLGLAWISAGERLQSASHLNEGFRILSGIESKFAADPVVLTSLGAVLQRKKAPAAAVRYFSRATELEPLNASHRLNLAIALMEAGHRTGAIAELEKVIDQDPSMRDAYILMAEIYQDSGQSEARRQILARYLKFMPQSIAVRKMLR